MQLEVYNLNAKAVKKISLPKEIFAQKLNPVLIAQAVRVYLSNQRQGSAKTLTRGEVSGSGKKLYRQKGTGRARHGDRKAPIFVKGGKAHGPTGEENYKLKMSKKMKKKALFSALSEKAKNKDILIISGLEKIEPKTKIMLEILKKLNAKFKDTAKRIILVLSKRQENIIRAASNLANVELVYVSQLNAYQVVKNDKIIFTLESIQALKDIFLKKYEK